MANSLLSDTSYNELVDCVYEALKVDSVELGKIVSLGQRLVDTVAQSSGSVDSKKKVLFEIVEKAVERISASSVQNENLSLYVSQLKKNLSHLLVMKPYFSLFFGLCCHGPLPLEPTPVIPQIPTELPVNHRPILNVLDSSCDEPVLIVDPPPNTVVEQNPQVVVLRTPKHDLD
jgi:hypothetical protein